MVVLGIAIFGPWAFDLINVPAEFPCTPPIIRLEGDLWSSIIGRLAVEGSGQRIYFQGS